MWALRIHSLKLFNSRVLSLTLQNLWPIKTLFTFSSFSFSLLVVFLFYHNFKFNIIFLRPMAATCCFVSAWRENWAHFPSGSCEFGIGSCLVLQLLGLAQKSEWCPWQAKALILLAKTWFLVDAPPMRTFTGTTPWETMQRWILKGGEEEAMELANWSAARGGALSAGFLLWRLLSLLCMVWDFILSIYSV